MLRLRIPQLIKDDDTFFITPKTDDDVQMGMQEKTGMYAKKLSGGGFRIMANVDWQKFNQQLKDTDDKDLYEAIEALVLQTKKGSLDKSIIESGITSKSREEYIRNLTIAFMSTPEYQMC